MPDTPESSPTETVIAFDFGLRRIGVAVGQRVTGSASPVATVTNGESGPDWQRLDAIVAEWQPDRLVVGMPQTADGRPTTLAQPIAGFIEALARYRLPVVTVDERLSSREASRHLVAARRDGRRGRIARGDIDAAAAAMIAERWLQQVLMESPDSE